MRKAISRHSCGTIQTRCMEKVGKHQAVYDILTTPVNFKLWGLSTSNLYKARGKIANLKHVLTGCQYSQRSYTWRHNEIQGIIVEIAKIFCETANEFSCIKTSIQFVKEGNISKTPHRNRHKPTLLDGRMNWCVIADVEKQPAFPTEITSPRQCPDLVIWSVNSKKLSLLNKRSHSRLISTGRISRNWKSTKTYVTSVLRMAGQQTNFLLRLDVEVLVRMQLLHF